MQPMHRIAARGGLNYGQTPFLAICEVTQSCDLACKHCRAAAQPITHPDELTSAEGKALMVRNAGWDPEREHAAEGFRSLARAGTLVTL
ncbi:MAG: hypothetical protein ACRD3N_03375 [Terracidiphilus sp.]